MIAHVIPLLDREHGPIMPGRGAPPPTYATFSGKQGRAVRRSNPWAMRRTSALAVTIGMIVVAALYASPVAAGPPVGVIDVEEDCLELVPAATSVTNVTDTGQTISLDVLVLLDGVDRARGEEVIAKAAEAYAPLEITLDARYETVAFEPQEPGDADGSAPSSSSTRLLNDMKKWTFGARPADVDVVYLLTSIGLSDAAGRADCIGGVRYAEAAFAVGENYQNENMLGLFYKNGTAKIAGHEIGHLMGAHHHYANCAEGTPGAIEEVGPTPCSLMFNFVDFLSLRFSVLEGAVIRGHAIEFASMGPDSEAIRSRAVTLSIEGDSAAGTIDSSDALCESKAEIRIQRYESEKPYDQQTWADVATGKSRRAGTFKVSFPLAAGQYRAFAPERSLGTGKDQTVCAQGASAPVTIQP